MSTSREGSETEVPSHRACQHCRSQKVRCMLDDEHQETCQRCAKVGRQCIFTPLQKRKQRKRTDTRVAELEREMRQMRATMHNKEPASANQKVHGGRLGNTPAENIPQTATVFPEAKTSVVALTSYDVARHFPNESRQPVGQRLWPKGWPSRFADRPLEGRQDVIDSGLMSMTTARRLFETYKHELYRWYPLVVIPDSTTADDMRRAKPTLFLAVIAAAAGKDNSDLSAELDKEVLHVYATRHVVDSEKSLELVQALLISAVWYRPPVKFGQLKYYEYICMAVTMAIDIGIASRPVIHRNLFHSNHDRGRVPNTNIHPLEDATNPDLSMTPRSRDHSPDTSNLESRRTFLACFIVCSGVSMSLRRPCMLRVNSYVRDCMDFLERAPDSVPLDRTLVAWGRLMIIAEEICSALCYDDPGGIASITELKTQMMLKDFEKRLSGWFISTLDADITESLAIMYYSIRIYLFELALHVDHSPEDFKAPFQMGPVHEWEGDDIPTQTLATAVDDCITSSHSLMKIWINTDPEKCRCFPVFTYIRISYAAFILAKLCLSSAQPYSRIGKILDRSSLKVELFLDRAILHVRAVVGTVRCRTPAIFLALLFKVRQWCLNPHLIEPSTASLAGPGGKAAKTASNPNGSGAINVASSDSDSSPTAISGTRSGLYESVEQYAAKTVNDLDTPVANSTPESHAGAHNGHQGSSAVRTEVPANSTPAVASYSEALPVSGTNGNDQMELDQEFIQFFEDMNAYSQGGLTGLDDWAMDFPALPEQFDWQAAFSTYGTTTM